MLQTGHSNLSKIKNISPEEGLVPTDVSGNISIWMLEPCFHESIAKGDGWVRPLKELFFSM